MELIASLILLAISGVCLFAISWALIILFDKFHGNRK